MATDIALHYRYAFVGQASTTFIEGFLMALAIIDDLGAVLVIALFYSSDIVVQIC